jgi:hypothetical protein
MTRRRMASRGWGKARPYRLARVPYSLRRARRDNVALVPGSLLGRRVDWQQMANRLPANAILIVLPSSLPPQKRALLASASILAGKGHQIRIVSDHEVRPAE